MPQPPRHLVARSPEYALLGFLWARPGHGYGLHQKLVAELGQVWHVSQSQTYAILKRLVTQGYVSSTSRQQEKLPPRQLLRISRAGRRRFEDWLETPSGSSVRAVRLEFITRLYFAERLFPERVRSIFADQSAEIEAALSRLEKTREAVPPEQTFNRLSLDLRLQQLRSVRGWLARCQHRMLRKSSRRAA
jgi:DNA-binding PadR family transcriptional regulator